MVKDPKVWKTLSSKQLFANDKITVQADEVMLPDGTTTTYTYNPSLNDSVIIIAVNSKGQLLLQREYSHPPSQVLWQLPGGSMKPNETIESAAQRELAEESGYKARKIEMLGYYFVQNRMSNKKQYVMFCTELVEHKLTHDDDEFITSHWIDTYKVKSMVEHGDIVNINLLATLSLWAYKKGF